MNKFLVQLIFIFSIVALAFVIACETEDDEISGFEGENGCGEYGDTGCTDSDDRACESAILANIERYENPEESDCAPSLTWSAELAAVALAHSKDMCDRDFFDHANPDGQSPFDRMDAAGINYVAAGENIAYGTNLTAELADELWMDEPQCEKNHRANILSRKLTHVGVGLYDCGSNVYITQDFATFDSSDIPAGDHPYCGEGF